ncbi:hypothetical protein PASE110613_14440 [Paenibacillus sediminis]|uniref:Uncharacterized protein n=1 Tax=Paenibacillus sediminis TaxID=664909 RepID=A0ABS4H7M5_9BACL|nr:hypothetical protein [Paenibacillus sediminis]
MKEQVQIVKKIRNIVDRDVRTLSVYLYVSLFVYVFEQ